MNWILNSILLAQAAVPPSSLPQQTTTSSAPAHLFFLIIYFIISAALVAAILSQTTKSEGLSGTIGGGKRETIFKGAKKGWEERLEQITNYLAVAFLICSTIITIIGF